MIFSKYPTKNQIEFSSSDFVARFNSVNMRIGIVIISIPVICIIYYRREEFLDLSIPAIFVSFMLLLGFTFFIYRSLDKRPKLIISKSGVWLPSMSYKRWEEIWYFDVKKVTKSGFYLIHLKLKDIDEEHDIDCRELDKSYDEVYSAMIEYSKGKDVIDLGYSEPKENGMWYE